MTQTPNLAIAHIAASQNQKEVTANEAFDLLDRALTDALDVDLSADDVTLTSAEFRRHIAFRCSGAVPGRQLQVPQQKRLFVVVNISVEHAIEVVRGSTLIDVGPGRTFVLYTDGSANGLVGAGGVGSLATSTTPTLPVPPPTTTCATPDRSGCRARSSSRGRAGRCPTAAPAPGLTPPRPG